jgi:hypothetical protein
VDCPWIVRGPDLITPSRRARSGQASVLRQLRGFASAPLADPDLCRSRPALSSIDRRSEEEQAPLNGSIPRGAPWRRRWPQRRRHARQRLDHACSQPRRARAELAIARFASPDIEGVSHVWSPGQRPGAQKDPGGQALVAPPSPESSCRRSTQPARTVRSAREDAHQQCPQAARGLRPAGKPEPPRPRGLAQLLLYGPQGWD